MIGDADPQRHAVSPGVTSPAGHKPDRDWDHVRVEMVKAMGVHCSVRRWKYHPGADDWYQGYDNWGWLARIALRHRSGNNCGDA